MKKWNKSALKRLAASALTLILAISLTLSSAQITAFAALFDADEESGTVETVVDVEESTDADASESEEEAAADESDADTEEAADDEADAAESEETDDSADAAGQEETAVLESEVALTLYQDEAGEYFIDVEMTVTETASVTAEDVSVKMILPAGLTVADDSLKTLNKDSDVTVVASVADEAAADDSLLEELSEYTATQLASYGMAVVWENQTVKAGGQQHLYPHPVRGRGQL